VPARAEKIAKNVAEVAGATAHKIAKFKTAEDIFGRLAFAHAVLIRRELDFYPATIR
jgi:hypothetical protein